MIVQVETTTFKNRQVRAGYLFDDVTLEIRGFWAENDTKSPLTMKTADPADSKKIVLDEYPPFDQAVKDVSGIKNEKGELMKLVLVDGALTLPFTLEMSCSWA